jgi:hypothetical protein
MNNRVLKRATKCLAFAYVCGALLLGATAAVGADDIVEGARISCQKDIDAYCKDVTRGEGRILQCLAAHADKISGRCAYALDDASLQLQRVGRAIKYVGAECKSDLQKHCADIPIGDGRIAQCLKKNEGTLSDDCKQSLTDTRMEIQ